MKKWFPLLLSIMLFQGPAFSQDLEKVMKEYETQLKNSKVPYGNNPSTGKYYEVRGIKFYTETYGSGKPILFIHGNGGSINNFIYQIPYFSTSYKVIVADSRAHGKTVDKGDSLTYEMMADDYAALLDAMHIDSAYVVGWSDGGINGLLLAIRHPKKVAKLAITGANLTPDTTDVFPEVLDIVAPTYKSVRNKKELTEQEKTTYKLTRLLMEQPRIPYTDLHNIQCPTLVMGGDHDVIREEHTLKIFQHIPKAYLWIVPNSGHAAAIVYRDDFNRNVDQFFQKSYRKIEKEARFF